MKVAVSFVTLAFIFIGSECRRSGTLLSQAKCTGNCNNALVEKMKELPFGCEINVGACRPIKCTINRFDRRCQGFCRPKMVKKEFECNGLKFVEKVVAGCVCQQCSMTIKGRVVERIQGEQGNTVSGIGKAFLTFGLLRGSSTDENGYFLIRLNTCPRKLVIEAFKDGYVSTMKVLNIPEGTQGMIENVQIVMFTLAPPVQVIPNEETVLSTTGAARVIIPAGTTFFDYNGNEATGNVQAILNFIDPSLDNFDDAPGVFLTDAGEQLMSFGVLNLRFQDDDGNSVLPDENIRVDLHDTAVTGYKLWTLNNDGQWKEKSNGLTSRRKRRQAGGDDLGSFGIEDIGNWINIDKIPSAEACFVKTRVFQDLSFTSEVPNGGVDTYQPKFLLKVGNSAPYQGLNLYRPATTSPGLVCHEVRCGDDPKIQGFVSVWTQETIGNGQSIPLPAIPVQLGNPNSPSTLDTELSNLNYQVNAGLTEAGLDFFSSPSGPLYTDKTTCEGSSLNDNALWFARRKPEFTSTDFGEGICYLRVTIYQRGPDNIEYLDQIQATSVWGTGPFYFADSLAQNSDFVYIPPDYACLRYRCSKSDDLTTVYLQPFGTSEDVVCYPSSDGSPYSGQFTAPDLSTGTPAHGYYTGLDENEVKNSCLGETDMERTATTVYCYLKQGDNSATDSTVG